MFAVSHLAALIEHLNRAAFAYINATAHEPHAVIELATGLAEYAIYLLPAMLVGLWLWGEPSRRAGLVLAVAGSQVALFVNQVAVLAWYHPRPFAIDFGHTYLAHAADSSFPSDHITFITAIALGLWWFCGYRGWALLTGLMALVVAWARVFLGVHFPLDMAGGAVTALTGVALMIPLAGFAHDIVMPRLALPLYRFLFTLPIRVGWAKR